MTGDAVAFKERLDFDTHPVGGVAEPAGLWTSSGSAVALTTTADDHQSHLRLAQSITDTIRKGASRFH